MSDENLNTVFVDTLPIVKQGAEERHKSMGIRVVQNSYTWGFDPVDDFAVQEYNIINVGTTDLQDVWVGIYTELATNNRQAFATWPPGVPQRASFSWTCGRPWSARRTGSLATTVCT